MTTHKDYPLTEIVAKCLTLTAQGHTVYQKWTCGGCKKRIGSENPNVLTEKGQCEECGHITNIKETGCNYLLVMRNVSLTEVAKTIMDRVAKDFKK